MGNVDWLLALTVDKRVVNAKQANKMYFIKMFPNLGNPQAD